MSRTRGIVAAAWALACAAGCAQPTEIVVVVDADPSLTVQQVTVDVFGTGVGQRASRTLSDSSELPLTLGLVPQSASVADVTIQVSAIVVPEGATSVGQLMRVIETQFVPGSRRMARVVLTPACVGYVCDDGESCDEAGCVDNAIEGSALPTWTGAPPGHPDCSARPENCNGFDDDCDGSVDEETMFATSSTDCGACNSACTDTCTGGFCGDSRVTRLAAGGAHACALRANGTIDCWGANHERQTTNASSSFVATATRQNGVGYVGVACGMDHTCARTDEGTVSCVGNGMQGALGSGESEDIATLGTSFVPVTGVTELDASSGYTLAISTGALELWGTFAGTAVPEPTTVDAGGVVSALAAGVRHACALLSDGTVACAGDNSRGQLGLGDVVEHAGLTPIPGLVDAIAISAGRDFTCTVHADHSVRCWGANDVGQLGAGAGADIPTPTVVASLTASSVSAARAGGHACVVTTTGTVSCWGANTAGAVGTGMATAVVDAPTVVAGLARIEEVACGGQTNATGFTCARNADGVVQCWGDDTFGQTGDGEAGAATLRPHVVLGALD